MNAAGWLPRPPLYSASDFLFIINQAEEVTAGNEKEAQEDFLCLQ